MAERAPLTAERALPGVNEASSFIEHRGGREEDSVSLSDSTSIYGSSIGAEALPHPEAGASGFNMSRHIEPHIYAKFAGLPELKCKTFSDEDDPKEFRSFLNSFDSIIGGRCLPAGYKLAYMK